MCTGTDGRMDVDVDGNVYSRMAHVLQGAVVEEAFAVLFPVR